jgi:chromosome segregation ATPase
MNDTLKSLTAALAAANSALLERQEAIAEKSSERDTLAAEIAGLDAGVEGAELAHAAAIAAKQLGEQSDSDSTGKAMDEARLALARKPELIHRHRVAAAVVAGLEAKYHEAHAKVEEVNAAHRAALIAELNARAEESLAQARALVEGLVSRNAELAAIRGLFMEAGERFDKPGLSLHDWMLNPTPLAVEAMKQRIRAELSTE